MGKRFRNFFKKRGKKKEEKKRKLKIGEIQVLFETGTSGPHAPSVPTTSGHADTQTITPDQLDAKTGLAKQEELCQENKLQGRPVNQKRNGPTLVDSKLIRGFAEKTQPKARLQDGEKRSKKKEEKKRKLKTGDIQVLFETGTSGPHAPSVATTSGHADTQTITPKQLDNKTGFANQEELCQENKLQGRPVNQKRNGQTLADCKLIRGLAGKTHPKARLQDGEKKGKKKEEKKRKLNIGEIQVLFETGTSGPHAPSVPTTSGHADTQTITPEKLDDKTGLAKQEEPCQENKLQGRPANQKRSGQTLVDRSQEFTDKLDEMIKQLTAMEASMEEEDKRRRLHPLGEKRDMSQAKEKKAVSTADRRASNSATNRSTVETAESLLERLTAQVQRNRHLQHGASHKIGHVEELSDGSNEHKKPSLQETELTVKQDNKCPTCNDMTGKLESNTRMKNLLSRCLSVFEGNSALTQASTEVRLVQEIRDVIGTDDTKLAAKPKTPPQAPRTPAELLNLKLESWDDIIARRLEERKKSPWGRYLLSKGAITTSVVQSKQPVNNRNDDDDSDDEIFVTPASSLTSLHTASTTTSSESLLNIPPMELLEPRPWRTNRGQQTQGQDYISEKWEQIHEKWRQVFAVSSNWSDETTTFYDALPTHSIVEKPPGERLI